MSDQTTDIVTLDVGGRLYRTTRSTLTCFPDSMLGAMFSGRIPTHRDENGHYFIDRNGEIFKYVLDFLRSSKLCLPSGFKELDQLAVEADFYQIEELAEAVRNLSQNDDESCEYVTLIIENHDEYSGSSAKITASDSAIIDELVQRVPHLDTYCCEDHNYTGENEKKNPFRARRYLNIGYSGILICLDIVFNAFSSCGFKYLQLVCVKAIDTTKEKHIFYRPKKKLK